MMRFICLKISRPMPAQRLRGITMIRRNPFWSRNIASSINGIAIQVRHIGANLPPAPGIEQTRTSKSRIDSSVVSVVPLNNAGDRSTRENIHRGKS